MSANIAANTCVITPIRSDAAATALSLLMYNSTTSELIVSTDQTATGTKTFVIDHPIDETRYLVHACIEGPESGVYYRGKGEIVNNHSTLIVLPHYVQHFAYDFNIQLTPIYDSENNHRIYCSEVTDNSFVVFGKNVKFFWIVHAKRSEIEVEPLKATTVVKGEGPYRWIHL
jgi:hypothetical protein